MFCSQPALAGAGKRLMYKRLASEGPLTDPRKPLTDLRGSVKGKSVKDGLDHMELTPQRADPKPPRHLSTRWILL
jgi:hypothetical protein